MVSTGPILIHIFQDSCVSKFVIFRTPAFTNSYIYVLDQNYQTLGFMDYRSSFTGSRIYRFQFMNFYGRDLVSF